MDVIPSPGARPIHLLDADPAWRLIMQSGVGVSCTVGVPVADFLAGELAIPADEAAKIDVILLDGMPVDEPAVAIVPDRARLALAAGLPGIAGLAMKSGSAVRALRGGITHVAAGQPNPAPGCVTLSLYSLVIPLLADHFLRRGVLVTASQIRRYAGLAGEGVCRFDGARVEVSALSARLAPEGDALYRLYM